MREFIFYTSYFYNYLLHKTKVRAPYEVVNDKIVLGSLPLKSSWSNVAQKFSISHILSAVNEYEVKNFVVDEEYAKSHGISYKRIGLQDFSGAPTSDQYESANEFIDTVGDGKRVYIHCKAGRTRSACFVAGYLIARNNMSTDEAIKFILSKRSVAVFREAQIKSLKEFESRIRN